MVALGNKHIFCDCYLLKRAHLPILPLKENTESNFLEDKENQTYGYGPDA